MIGKLTGEIEELNEDSIILNVNGVGYLVMVTSTALGSWKIQQKVSLHIETQVKEDSITLFGFTCNTDKAFFNLLKTVQGVGSKIALLLLDLGTETITQAVLLQQATMLTRVPGVGAKVANRIISELPDKLKKFSTKHQVVAKSKNSIINSSIDMQTIEALKSLGYQDKEAANAVVYAKKNMAEDFESATVEQYIKIALSYFSKEKTK